MRLILTIIVATICHSVISQEKIDELKIIDTLSKAEYNKIFNNQFSTILAGSTNVNTIGGYASADIKDKQITFSPCFVGKNGNILSTKFNGGITDEGLSDIFTNSKFNTNLSFDFEYHFLNNRRKRNLIFDRNELNSMVQKDIEINSTFRKDTIDGNNRRTVLEIEFVKLKKEQDTLRARLTRLNDSIQPKYKLTKDSLIYQLELNSYNLDQVNRKISEYGTNPNLLIELITAAHNKQATEFTKNKRDNLKVRGFSMDWFSAGVQIKHDEFKTFDPTAVYANQIKNQKFVSTQFRFQYSNYKWRIATKGTRYFAASISYSYKTNQSDLTAIEIVETKNHGDTLNNRSSSEKYNAYTGAYKKDLNELNVKIDYYKFPSKKLEFAYHLYANGRFTEAMKPVLNAGIGILMPLKNKTKDEPIVNVEMYYTAIDLTKSTRNDTKLYKKSSLGLRFTFPIDFNLHKK